MLMLENLNDLNLYYTITLRKLALKNNITFEQAKFLTNIPYDGVILTGFAKKLGIDNSTLTRNIEKLIVLELVKIKKSESDQIVEALKQKGIDVPYMVKDDEGHGFYNEENRFDFYREMSAFLEKHLK